MLMSVKNIPVIILGMSVNGLGVARSLGRRGVRVLAVDCQRQDRPGMMTRHAQSHLCPNPQQDPKATVDFLKNLIHKNGGQAVLLPTSDLFVSFVHFHRDQLAPLALFAMPKVELMDQLLTKMGQFELARKYQIPVSKTLAPRNIEEVKETASQLRYPVLIKGLNTISWRARFGHQKAVSIDSADSLIKQYTDIYSKGYLETVTQEIIEGDDSSHFEVCSYIDRQGVPLLKIVIQKIRQYPCDFGIGASVRSARDAALADLAVDFLSKIGYWGVATVEFKRDTRDGQFKMIEINPRLWAQNSLADACGQNFSFTAYLDIIGEKVEPQYNYRENIKWIAFREDRASFLGYYRQGRQSFGSWIKSVSLGPRVWAIWDWKDPLPFLREVNFGFLLFIKIFSRIKKLCLG